MIHEVKCFKDRFVSLLDGTRVSDTRYLDRDYNVGDCIIYIEGWDTLEGYITTGYKVKMLITYIDTYGVQPGFGTLSLERYYE